MSKAMIEENLARFDEAFCDFLHEYMRADRSDDTLFYTFLCDSNPLVSAQNRLFNIFDELTEMFLNGKVDGQSDMDLLRYESIAYYGSLALFPEKYGELLSDEKGIHNAIRGAYSLMRERMMLDHHSDLKRIFFGDNPIYSDEGLHVDGSDKLSRTKMVSSLCHFLSSKYELN